MQHLFKKLSIKETDKDVTTQSSDFPEVPRGLQGALAASHESVAAELITTADRPFVIKHVNKAWTRLCGWEGDEAVGQTIKSLGMQDEKTNPSTLKTLYETLELERSSGFRAVTTVRLVNYVRDGRCLKLSVAIEPLVDSSTGHIYFLGILNQIEWLPSCDRGDRMTTEPLPPRKVYTTPPDKAYPAEMCPPVPQPIPPSIAEMEAHLQPARQKWAACQYAAQLLYEIPNTDATGARLEPKLRDLLLALIPLLPNSRALQLMLVIRGVLTTPMEAAEFEGKVRTILGEDVATLSCLVCHVEALDPRRSAAQRSHAIDCSFSAALRSVPCSNLPA